MATGRSLVVLAGGQSRRMGRDKAALPIDGGTLLQHVIGRLRPVVDEVIVAGGHPLDAVPGVRWVGDEMEERGPLGGMVAGLQAARSPLSWVVACDAPDVEPRLGDRLFERAGTHDAVVPRAGGQAQGTCAVYRSDLAARIRDFIRPGPRSIIALLQQCDVLYLDEEALRDVDPQLASFQNLNSFKEYERWLRKRAR